ncbi:energy-coupling factor transporter transmembrane component T [Aeromicrobium sp. IC_218]|uniref:energy-coupling factor transporter transmembrane component T family protein n=1 Tax=Aeromicrobium sp. IC_218 TaxID=2545468 RepID=UPI00103CD2F1|nr:energy-coupling factor transporter transmembrane component T [Aeromicrobium sp. IC_218]TCI96853.1 energy-coupling factor transporter transmembrane protein EcfT [Aeromicrobium sp. IC_218]
MTDLLGAYRPGRSVLHRIPAGPKLGLLATYGAIAVALHGPASAVVLLVVSLALTLVAGMPVRRTLRQVRGLLVLAVVVAAFQTWQRGWPVAVHVVGDLLALVLAALVFTATTPVDDVLTAVERGLRPFRRLGVRPERVALAFSLVLRAIPGILETARETRAAAKARGLERSPRALLVPLAVRTVGRAYETGDALAARGLGDD